MKIRSILAGALALALSASFALGQTNQGSSPLTPTKGGTNSAFVGFAGPATSIKTFTLPNASDTIATLGAIQTVSAAKTFNNATLLLAGSSSGTTTLNASATASGVLTLPAVTDTLIAKATTDTLTNKTYDTAGAGNSFSINGLAATANTGTGSVVRATTPTLVTPVLGVATATSINKMAITAPATSATLTIPDGVTLTGPASSGTAMTLGNTETVTGVKTFGSAGAVGRFKLAGTTSGSTVLDASATASGTLTLPAVTDTLIAKATTDTLTNKTFDTAGTGNSFSINGVAATANTGTGSVVRATGPTLSAPVFTGSMDNQGTLKHSAFVTSTQITAAQNNYTATDGSNTCTTKLTLRISSDASRNITGLSCGQAEGDIRIIHNVGAQSIVLTNADAGSTAANQFLFGGDVTLLANYSITIRYDGVASRWRAITTASAGGGGGVTSATIAAGGGISVSGTCTITTSGTCTVAVDGSFGFRNRIINPTGQIAQTAFAATSDATYSGFDQWYVLNEANPTTPSQNIAPEPGTPYQMRLTQSNASAQRMGWATPLETDNVRELRSATVTLSARVQMSASTTLRYAVIEWSGTADAPTKDVVNNWASGTFTTGNFFISTTTAIAAQGSIALTANTQTSITPLTFTLGSSHQNLIVFFWTDSQQAQNVTLDLGRVQLEKGSTATNFAIRPIAIEQTLCNRFQIVYGLGVAASQHFSPGMAFSTTIFRAAFVLPAIMRVAPTGSLSAASDFNVDDSVVTANGSSASFTTSVNMFTLQLNTGASLTAARAGFIQAANTNARIFLRAQL